MSNYSKSAIAIVYLSGFIQGIALILYPAAGPILTSEDFHQLSSGQFGALFVPQILLAILASFSAPALAQRWGMKTVLAFGLAANLLSMSLLAGSHLVIGQGSLPFVVLMLGTGALGLGFGFTITAVNPYAYQFFPGKEASAVTSLHILLGLGTSLSSIILGAFSAAGFWWGAAVLTGGIALGLLLWMLPLAMPLKAAPAAASQTSRGIPSRLWLFFAIVFFYGACEATFGNWAPIYLEKQAGLSAAGAALGLSLFWGAIAGGRLLFTLLALKFELRLLHIIMPFVVAAVFYFIPQLSGATANYVALTAAGLGLSFYFPYSISLATDAFPSHSALVSGMLVAAIQLGTGVSSNVIGQLNEFFSLGTIIQFSAVYAALMGGLALFVYLQQKSLL